MSRMSKKKVIAITGSMGSGKSKVSEILSQKYPVTDCDQINSFLLQKGNEGYFSLISKPYIHLLASGEIDKVAMASAMFADPSIKKEVESILHPLIFEEIGKWVRKQKENLVFVEVPILFEIHAEKKFDEVWCVVCDEKIALDRLQKYRHIPEKEAKARLNCQMSVEEKISKSQVVLYNNGLVSDLEKEIEKELERMK